MSSHDECRRQPPPPSAIRSLDARIKIILLLGACFLTQYAPDRLLPLWLCVLAPLFLIREMRTAGILAMLRGSIYFALFWLIMKVGTDMAGGTALAESLPPSLVLAAKLLALAIVGMTFAGLSSPLETGRAAAWFLAPVLGKRAWMPALVVALTSWFLPTNLRLAGDVLAAIKARGLTMPCHKKAMLVVGTSVRILEDNANELAVGLASRRVDDCGAWAIHG